jgi:ankyrin repeat protein
VEWLTENGAEADATNLRRETPLFWAAAGTDGSVTKRPARKNLGQAEDAQAEKEEASTREGKTGVVKFLLTRGANVNASDEEGRAPLACAAYAGDVEITKLLVARGAKVNTKNKDGWTALCVAANSGYAGVVKLLLDRGADAGIKVKDIYTPLNYAVLNGHREAAELLLAAGSQNRMIEGAQCPGCGSNKQVLISAPLFMSDRQKRKILRCGVCGMIWSKREVEWRGSLQAVFATLVAAFFCIEMFRDRHGVTFLRIALVASWILIVIKEFSKSSKPSRIWVQGAPQGAATD